jgi:MYXO-CTERM domain-containing protein
MRAPLAAATVAGFLLPAGAHAAVTMTLEWQTSLDGSSWQGGERSVPIAATRVHVRLLAGWRNAPTATLFGRAVFDAVMEGVAGAGAGDVVEPGTAERLGSMDFARTYAQANSRRFGEFLVFDGPFDSSAPGTAQTGVQWLVPVQNLSTVIVTGNPIDVFHFTVNLDGSLGRRDLYALGAPPVTGNPVVFWGKLHGPTVNFEIDVEAVEHRSAAIIVPAPGAAGAVALGLAAYASRRRRQHHLA